MKRLIPILALVLAAGCSGHSDLPPGAGASPAPLPPPITESAPVLPEPRKAADEKPLAGGLEFTASAEPAVLPRGKTLNVSMELRNTGQDMQILVFPTGQDFDLEARRVQNGVVARDTAWSWAAGKMFTMIFRQIPLRGGKSLKFTATWDGSANGETLPRGEYEIIAFTASKPRLQAAPFRVILK